MHTILGWNFRDTYPGINIALNRSRFNTSNSSNVSKFSKVENRVIQRQDVYSRACHFSIFISEKGAR